MYAPPKVGDSALARSIKSTLSVYGIVNYRDPVPRIPHYVNLQRYTPLLKGYVSVMDASRESIYFNRKHRAIEFGSRTNPATRERKIRRDQGNPRPILLFRGGAMSNEWKFHHGKFDTAYAYFKLKKSRFSPARDTGIEPELNPGTMFINKKKTWIASKAKHLEILMGDKYKIRSGNASRRPLNGVGGRIGSLRIIPRRWRLRLSPCPGIRAARSRRTTAAS